MPSHISAAALAVAASLPALLTAQSLVVRDDGDHVVVPHASALVPAQLTVEAWIELDPGATDTYGTIVRKNVDTAEAYTLRLSRFQRSDYAPEFNLTTSTQGTRIIRASTSIPPGIPTHIAASYDGSAVRIYVDGQLVESQAVSGILQDTGNELWIGEGESANPIGETFHGRIDAVRIWDGARSAAEIDATLDVELTSAPGLVAAWNFDCDLADATGSGNGATAFQGGVPRYADEFANFAGALELDAPGDSLTVAHDPALAPRAVFVEAWCILDSSVTSTYPTLVRKNVDTAEAYTLRLSSFQTGGRYIPEFNFTTADGTTIVRALGTTIPLDTPVHIAGSYDGITACIYVDGEPVERLAARGPLRDTGGDLRIGLGDAANSLGEQFVGRIDAVRIWDRVPATCEIVGGIDRELAAGDGLVAAWNFDGGLGDVTGNGHDAIGTGIAYAVGFATFAQALKLPTGGADGWVEIAHAPELVPDQLTIEGVVQIDPARRNTYGTIARKDAQSSATYLLRVWPDSSPTALRAEFHITTAAGPVVVQAAVPGDAHAPHHVAGTFDGSRARLFIDGRMVGSGIAPSARLVDTGGAVRIGQGDSTNSLGEQLEGRLDSVRLWNHARSETDLARTMHREIDSMPGLIAAWNFNGDLTDATGNGFDAVASGSTDLVAEFAPLVGSACSPLAYGDPSSNCTVTPRVFASSLIEPDGTAVFGCLDAPANAVGLFVFSSDTLPTPIAFGDLEIWVGGTGLFSVPVPVTADATGRTATDYPLSDRYGYSATRPVAIQYFWLDPTGCGVTDLGLTSSDALRIGPF